MFKVIASGLIALGGCAAPATIGGHEVPAGLVCEEDEAIWFDESADKVLGEDGRMGFPLGCVHIDSIRYPAVPASDVTVCSSQPELCSGPSTSPDVGD